ncbi:hypothetical protein BCR37DRAFT_385158 [Protomyces lactucae-debilis]|uniref:Golgi apparatus membrane protein TVP38 n=1 Tax=Protomyces lactucae-debilis TaxID=2754530 RepID=A0A1Y2FV69_PROLT|nr:uncharacterized protein BCR37DRAFT_385158 [Protomyces lactucae-debilis]ORY87900.1 hypothetical protein BCR37DRAFT_385158 [Protomyces lactucae-debilis]
MDRLKSTARRTLKQLSSLSLGQKLYGACFISLAVALTVLFAVCHRAIFKALEPLKADMRQSRWAWLALVGATTATSFPPLIGYSTSITLAGYVYGFSLGWSIGALGSVIGAAVTFAVYRGFLTGYASRMTESNHHFRALTQALDGSSGMTLLIMIRYCPFPFSLSNAALSTIPSISYGKFMAATVIALPRIWIHAFIGSRLASLADVDGKDKQSALFNWLSIVLGLALGIATSYLVYRRTMAIAARARTGTDSPIQEEEAEEQDFNFESRRLLH